MLKLFVNAAQLALPLCVLTATFIVNRAYAPAARQRMGRATMAGLLVGAGAAAVIVWLRLNTRHISLPLVNLWGGVALLLALLAFLAAMWAMGRRELVVDEAIGNRHRLLTMTSTGALAVAHLFYGIPLYLALDGVVPMGGVLFASDSLINLIGYLLGVLVVTAIGIAFALSLSRVPGLARRIVTTVVVGIALVTQWPPLYQQFSTARFLPKSSLNFCALLLVQRNSVAILLAILAVVVLTALIAYLTRRRHAPVEAVPAEHRLVKAEALSRRRVLGWSAALGASLTLTYTVGKRIAEAVPEVFAHRRIGGQRPARRGEPGTGQRRAPAPLRLPVQPRHRSAFHRHPEEPHLLWHGPRRLRDLRPQRLLRTRRQGGAPRMRRDHEHPDHWLPRRLQPHPHRL